MAININNVRFHRYGNVDSTFILHWNFNINHSDDSDGKSILIQCWLAVWEGSLKIIKLFLTHSFVLLWIFSGVSVLGEAGLINLDITVGHSFGETIFLKRIATHTKMYDCIYGQWTILHLVEYKACSSDTKDSHLFSWTHVVKGLTQPVYRQQRLHRLDEHCVAK